MTREERRQRRQRNLIMAICIGILAVWFAALLCSTAGAAYMESAMQDTRPQASVQSATARSAALGAEQIDPLTEALATIGACWVAWALMRGIEWLDKPKKERHARANERTACEIQF